jgi:4-amino-4-deoxy-L-arabinose transferase-like glycosyltransferase
MLGEDEWIYMELGENFANLTYPAHNLNGGASAIPPLVSLLYAIPFIVLGANLWLAKIITALFAVGTLIVTYLFGRELSPDNKKFSVAGIAAVSLILTSSLFSNMSMLAYVDVPIAFFSMLYAYLFTKTKSLKSAIALGAIGGVAFFMKVSSFILPMSLFIYALFMYFQDKDFKKLKYFMISIATTAAMVAAFALRNMLLFSYPYVEGLNLLFKAPPDAIYWGGADITKILSPTVDIMGTFSTASIFFFVIGLIYAYLTKNKKAIFPLLITALFFALYFMRDFLGMGIGDARYFIIIFPQFALIGGYLFSALSERNKYFILATVAVLALGFYISFSTMLGTSQSVRYPSNYVEALTWLKSNTDPSATVFTAYSGSVHYFANRNSIWAVSNFPDIMTATNSTDIHNMLKAYNISYILVWRGIVAENYIVPESNLIGAFTTNFVNTVYNDNTSFTSVYQNQDNIIFKVN